MVVNIGCEDVIEYGGSGIDGDCEADGKVA